MMTIDSPCFVLKLYQNGRQSKAIYVSRNFFLFFPMFLSLKIPLPYPVKNYRHSINDNSFFIEK